MTTNSGLYVIRNKETGRMFVGTTASFGGTATRGTNKTPPKLYRLGNAKGALKQVAQRMEYLHKWKPTPDNNPLNWQIVEVTLTFHLPMWEVNNNDTKELASSKNIS